MYIAATYCTLLTSVRNLDILAAMSKGHVVFLYLNLLIYNGKLEIAAKLHLIMSKSTLTIVAYSDTYLYL